MPTTPIPAEIEAVARQILDGAFAVHRTLGPGLLESVYELCLGHELAKRGLRFHQQVAVPIHYGDLTISSGLRLDILVEDAVIVELKAIEKVLPLHQAQLLTYLKLTGKRLGLLINFNVPALKDGIKRVAL